MKSAASAESTSGAAVIVAGSTVVVAILGLYISGVPFVGALGLAAAIVVAVTMLAALTLVPAFMGVVRDNVRALPARVKAHRAGISAQEQAKQTAAVTDEHHEHSASPAGAAGSAGSLGRGGSPACWCSWCWPSRCCRST